VREKNGSDRRLTEDHVRRSRLRALLAVTVLAAVLGGAMWTAGATGTSQPPEFWRCVAHEEGLFKDSKCSAVAEEAKGAYEAKPGVGELGNFSAASVAFETGKALELQSNTLTLICSGVKMTGFFNIGGAERVRATLKGCHVGTEKCSSAGQLAGTIVSVELSGMLGWLQEATREVGLDLAGPAGVIAEFECFKKSETFTAPTLQLRGSAIGKLAGNVGTYSKKFTLTFADGAGTEIESFEGGAPDVLVLRHIASEAEEPIALVHLAFKGSSVGALDAREA
jgi:hypothetical protein